MNFKKDSNSNIIFGNTDMQINCKIKFMGRNNLVFFAGSSKQVDAVFSGDNSVLFIGAGSIVNGKFQIMRDTLCYIGDGCLFNGISFRVFEHQNIIVGNDAMFSWSIWAATGDHHLIYDYEKHKRLNHSQSVFIGDHVWAAQESAINKGSHIYSGSILGAKSLLTNRAAYSNAVYAGVPAKQVKRGIFWDHEDFSNNNKSKEEMAAFDGYESDRYKFSFEKEHFLNPKLLDAKIKEFDSPFDKLEFVYDYIYSNKHKNRFALFEDSDISGCKLYRDESFKPFSEVEFHQT